MGYLSNQPGTKITLEEEVALAQLADIGNPGDVLTVNDTGTGLEYKPVLISGYLKLDQTTPQTTVGRFIFPALTVDTNTIYVDEVNHRLGIGLTTPRYLVEARLDQNATTRLSVVNLTAGTSAQANVTAQSDSGIAYFKATSSLSTSVSLEVPSCLLLRANSGLTGGIGITTGSVSPLRFGVNDVEVARFSSTGKFGIGLTEPTATLHLKAGIQAAGGAPLKFTSGLDLSTTEAGVMEYDGTNFHLTNSGLIRRNIGTEEYIQSRLQNLITNGTGLLGDNTNFSTWAFDKVETYSGGGSFKVTTSATKTNDEYIAIDPTKTYCLSAYIKSGDTGGSNYNAANKQYFGFVSYDIDKLTITPDNSLKYAGSTDTTLAAPLNPGDTTVTLNDATGWYNGTTGNSRHFCWYGYTNSLGYTYPNYTYTRNTTQGLYTQTPGAWAVPTSGNIVSPVWASADKSLTRGFGSFITDGATAGMTITSTNASNPGVLTIATVTDTKLTFVEAVTDSTATTVVTYVGQGITGNVIKLRTPWAGPALSAGSAVRNNASGGTYQYTVLSNISIPNSWTGVSGYLSPASGSALYNDHEQRSGTAYVRMICLVNYQGASDNYIRYSNVTLSEINTRYQVYLSSPTTDETAYRFDYTVNKASGTNNDTGVIINQIDTASPGTSLILDLQQNGTSRFNVDNAGVATVGKVRGPGASGLILSGGVTNSTLNIHTENTSGTTDRTNVTSNGGTNTMSAGTYIGWRMAPIHNASGTNATTDFLIDRTNTAVGSGTQQFMEFKLGGASRLAFTTAGNLTVYGGVGVAASAPANAGMSYDGTTLKISNNFSGRAIGFYTNGAYGATLLDGKFGIGTVTPKATLHVVGGQISKVTSVTDTYSVLLTDYTVVGNKATAFTITLPTAVADTVGQIFNIKNIGAGVITVDGYSTETIDGLASFDIAQWESITVQCNAVGSWIIL